MLVSSYNEPLTFGEWLFLGKCYLDSESMYYPIENGFIGKAMLMNALTEISQGVPYEKVIKRYKLDQGKKSLKVIDKRAGRGGMPKQSPIQALNSQII